MALPSSLSLEVVKKYAPAALFHRSEQYFPCSIEYLLSGSTLNFRKWSLNVTIPHQHCFTPHAAKFQGYYVLAYKSYDSEDMWVTRTKDPTDDKSWELFGVGRGQQRASKIDLGFCVFKETMYIVYTEADTGSAQLWVTWSNDFINWPFQKIPSQYAWGVALTALGDKMFLVYSSYDDSHMKWSWTGNGTDWNIMDQVRGEDTNQTPALVTSGDTIYCVFSSSNHDSHLNIITYTEEKKWLDTGSWDVGQSAGQVTLAADPSGKLLMAFSETHSSQFWAVESVDHGKNWINAQEIPAKGTVPSLLFYNDAFQLSWAGTDDDKSFCNCSLTSDLGYHFTPISHPTQADLEAVSSDPMNLESRPNFFLDVDNSVWHGQSLKDAPMYYAVQETETTITIHYIYLYAYQPGQTFRVAKDGGHNIDCILWDIGYHQADVEHFAVVLQPSGESGSFTIQEFIFEADGDQTAYKPDEVDYFDDNRTHAVACVAKSGHGFWNPKAFPDYFHELTKFTTRIDELNCTLMIGPFFNDPKETSPEPQMWRPWEMSNTSWRQLGLTGPKHKEKPINDQLWSLFQGRLGISQEVSLLGGTYIDNSNMNGVDWAFVWAIYNGGKLLNKLPDGFSSADGPVGPGQRDWITNPIPVTK